MKILLVATSIEDFSGASKCLIELASSLIREGHEVIVSIPKREGPIRIALCEKNIPFVVMREYQCWYKEKSGYLNPLTIIMKRILNEITVVKCRRYLLSEKFDIVHINALTAYAVGKAAIKQKIPVIWHIREFMEEDLGISFTDSSYSLKLLNRATQFIAISQPISKKWTNYLRVPIKVIHDGVPIKNYYVAHKNTHRDIKVLLYGRIVPGKGQHFYVKTAEKVLKSVSVPCTFYFAGKIENNNYFNECIKSIQKAKLENKIKYLGEVNDIQKLLKNIDIVCVCSTKEGFGRVTVEAMLGNCLVVGAASGATTELIQDGINGVLYHPDDQDDFSKKLVTCIEHFDSYKDIVMEGQKYALSHFTDKKNTSEIISIYEKMKGGKR